MRWAEGTQIVAAPNESLEYANALRRFGRSLGCAETLSWVSDGMRVLMTRCESLGPCPRVAFGVDLAGAGEQVRRVVGAGVAHARWLSLRELRGTARVWVALQRIVTIEMALGGEGTPMHHAKADIARSTSCNRRATMVCSLARGTGATVRPSQVALATPTLTRDELTHAKVEASPVKTSKQQQDLKWPRP